MKNTLFIFMAIISLFLNNCKKDSKGNSVVEINIDISYKDALGNDLLDVTKQNHFSSDSIMLYSLINGKKIEILYPNLSHPKMFYIYKNDSLNLNLLRVSLEQDSTLIELNKRIIDTITCTIDKSNGNEILRKVWYNSVLKWEYGVTPQITIIK
jgi:hypothetical protein